MINNLGLEPFSFYSLVFFIWATIFTIKWSSRVALIRIIRFDAKNVMINEKGSAI